MWKENGLSDVTYALCCGSRVFLRFFVDFFFHDFDLDAESLSIERESSDGRGNRPDFRVTDQRNGVFFIEVKIWDRNHHFDSYVKSLIEENLTEVGDSHISESDAKKRLGYIAAYSITSSEVPESVGCPNVKTWEQLYSTLKRWSFFEDDAIRAYGMYLSNVCGLHSKIDLDNYRFNMKDFVAIRTFMSQVDEALKIRSDEIVPYSGSSRWFRQNAWMGRFFEWKNYAGGDNSVWGWLGGYFGDDVPQIYVWFEDKQGWGNLVCDHFGRPTDETRSVWYSKYDKALYAFMKKQDNGDVKGFFNRAISLLEGTYESRDIGPVPKKGEIPDQFNSLLAMRKFPMSLEKWISEEKDTAFRIVITGRDENPSLHSRVTFRVESDNQGTTKSVDGWLGVNFESGTEAPTVAYKLGHDPESKENILDISKTNGDMTQIVRVFRSNLDSELQRRAF